MCIIINLFSFKPSHFTKLLLSRSFPIKLPQRVWTVLCDEYCAGAWQEVKVAQATEGTFDSHYWVAPGGLKHLNVPWTPVGDQQVVICIKVHAVWATLMVSCNISLTLYHLDTYFHAFVVPIKVIFILRPFLLDWSF